MKIASLLHRNSCLSLPFIFPPRVQTSGDGDAVKIRNQQKFQNSNHRKRKYHRHHTEWKIEINEHRNDDVFCYLMNLNQIGKKVSSAAVCTYGRPMFRLL